MRIGVQDVPLILAIGDQEISTTAIEVVDKLQELALQTDPAFDFLGAFKAFLVTKKLREDTSNTLVGLLLEKINQAEVADQLKKKALGEPT